MNINKALLFSLSLVVISCGSGPTYNDLCSENRAYFEALQTELIKVASELKPTDQYPSTTTKKLNLVRKQGPELNMDTFPIERLEDQLWIRGPRPMETNSWELRSIFSSLATCMDNPLGDEQADELEIGQYKFGRQIKYVVLGKTRTKNRYGDGLAEKDYYLYSIKDKKVIVAFTLSNVVDPVKNKTYVQINTQTGKETSYTRDAWETKQSDLFRDQLEEKLKEF